MIQFNLLPDVKLEYIKARRMKRLVVLISMAAAGVSLAVLIILFLTVQVAQKKHISDLNKDIATEEKAITSTEDLDKILTIQNQLNKLPQLHDDKILSSRIFGYIQQVSPVLVTISNLTVDFTANTISISGTADNVITVNKFADTLKFATYKSESVEDGKPFSNVVTTMASSTGKTSFSLSFNFEPVLFSTAETPKLIVPNKISTRSETEKPSSLFKEAPAEGEGN
jgi:Tfp pilus assembly protein PilN